MALKEALFELNTSFSSDGCIIVNCGAGRLDAYLPEGERVQGMGSRSRSWVNGNGETLSCGYTIRVYEEGMGALELPIGGMLTNASGGFRENLKAYLHATEGSVFGEGSGVYGPSWALLSSYARLCDSLSEGQALKPQGHGPSGGEAYIPRAVSGEKFLQTMPKITAACGTTERGDPVRFGVYPWLRSMDVRYGIEVERSDFYYVPRIVEHVSVGLYNPYDAPLELASYEVRVSGKMPELAIRVGGGNSMSALLKHNWEFSVALNPREERQVEIPARIVFEFPPMLENPNSLGVGLGGALPEVGQSSARQGSGRSLREAFFNKRKKRSLHKELKPMGVRQVHFYLGGEEPSLLQRVTEPSFLTFDLSASRRIAIEKRVWELPHLGALAQVDEQPLFAWNYKANGRLSHPEALLVSASGIREEGEAIEVSLPRGLHSRMDLEAGLRSFYGTGPPVLGGAAEESFWTDTLSTALWDRYFYPLEPECYVAHERGAPIHLPIDPQDVLLKGAFSLNTLDASRWERFLSRHTPWLGQGNSASLAAALSLVLRERVPLRSVAAFWGEQGAFSEAIRRAELERVDLMRLKGAVSERLFLREDTFIIHGQGFSGDAEAFCEAIVQRVSKPSSLSGRGYRIVAFRWAQKNLSP